MKRAKLRRAAKAADFLHKDESAADQSGPAPKFKRLRLGHKFVFVPVELLEKMRRVLESAPPLPTGQKLREPRSGTLVGRRSFRRPRR